MVAGQKEVHEAVSSILENRNRCDDGQVFLRPLEILRHYLEGCNESTDFLRTNSKDVSVRDALSFLPSSELTELTRVLSGLMEDRKEAVMPMTQDVDANEEAMSDTRTP